MSDEFNFNFLAGINESEDDDRTELQKKRDEIEQLKASLKASQDSIQDADAELRRELEEINRKAKALQEKRKKLDVDRWDISKQLKAAQRNLEQIQREEEIARRAAQIEADRAEHLAYVEKLTENAKWNGRALEHQRVGASFLSAAKRAICADSMGLGKTLQSIMYLDMLGAKRVLIISPGDVMSNFVNEMFKWSERVPWVIGKQPKADQAAILSMLKAIDNNGSSEGFVVIVNYEAWARNQKLIDQLIDMHFDTLIVDEAHTIKERKTRAFQGVQAIVEAQNVCPMCKGAVKTVHSPGDTYAHWECAVDKWRSDRSYIGLSDKDRRSVQNILCMTGTPVLNKPSEIYPLLRLIDNELFPSEREFLHNYCQVDSWTGKWTWNRGGQAMLAEKLAGMYLRRTYSSAGIKLPPQTITVHEIDLDADIYPLQAEILRQVREHAAVQVENAKGESDFVPMTNILSIITRERQATTWPGGIKFKVAAVDPEGSPVVDEKGNQVFEIVYAGENYKQSIKIDKAVELAGDLINDGHRVVIFSQFTAALNELQRRFQHEEIRSITYTGATKDDERQMIKADFDRTTVGEEYRYDVLLCHYRVGGVGLNLTAATQIIILDEEWNPGKNEQAYDRIHRMGQVEETGVHILRMTKSIDVWMEKLNAMKKKIVDGFNDANDQLAIDKEFAALVAGLTGKEDI